MWAWLVSLAIHGALAAALVATPASKTAKPLPATVELSVVAVAPFAAVVPSPKQEPVPPPPAKPTPARSRPAPVPPPPANQAPPAKAPPDEPPKPVFGVTADSVVEGPAEMAVPVGNTVATAPTTTAQAPEKAPVTYAGGAPGGTGTTPFSPVPESFVKQWPKTLEEVRAPFPEEARRMDMSGTVRLRVGIDENGRVRDVKVIKRAGFGFDEAAAKAMWRFRFAPAQGQDGRPVPFRINYDYTFTPPS